MTPPHPAVSHRPTQRLSPQVLGRRGPWASPVEPLTQGREEGSFCPGGRIDLWFGMQRLQGCEVHQRSRAPRCLRPPRWASFSSVGVGAAPRAPGRPHPLKSSRLPVSCELALRWREGLGGPFPGGTSRDAGVRWVVWGLGYLLQGDLDLLGPQVGLAAPSTVPQPTPVWKMWVARDLQSPS